MASSSSILFNGRTKNIATRSNKYLEEALYKRLFKKGGSEAAIRKQLDEFLKTKKLVFKWEVGDTIRKLREYKRYGIAVQLSEEMAHRGMNKTVGDQAIHLDLVAKARGLEAAEKYFVELPEASKTYHTYGALLCCYCKERKTEKAEALYEKMKELKIKVDAVSYNNLMVLYTKINQPEKVLVLIQEMKAADVVLDAHTYIFWMRALEAGKDISGVEKVMDELKRDEQVTEDWKIYSNLAFIYVDAGLSQKAENALKELEERLDRNDPSGFHFLILLYGRIGKLSEVYRVWDSLKQAFKRTSNLSYSFVIQALIDLKDIPGAEKCYTEWVSGKPTYDIRMENILIKAYTEDGQLEKAEKLLEQGRKRGAEPDAKTWKNFMHYYLKSGEEKSAVDCIAKGISAGIGYGKKWLPSPAVVLTLMQHFEQEKDVVAAEEFLEILQKDGYVSRAENFESLVRTYAAAGKTSQSLCRRLKMEKLEVSEPVKKLLDVVCVQ